MTPQGSRLERFVKDSLDDEQRSLFDEIAGGKRASGVQLFRLLGDDGALEGPFNAFLLQPRLGRALQAVGAAVRYETSLPDRARELAILVVAHRWDSSFEWYAHEAVGRHLGLTDDELAAVRDRDWSRHHDEVERVVAATADRLVWEGDLDDVGYREAVESLGESQLFELITLVGYYAALALQLRVYRVAAPAADA
jgi:4-carboxymuconolactone decarboxylase